MMNCAEIVKQRKKKMNFTFPFVKYQNTQKKKKKKKKKNNNKKKTSDPLIDQKSKHYAICCDVNITT